jgi:hypothetical protein
MDLLVLSPEYCLLEKRAGRYVHPVSELREIPKNLQAWTNSAIVTGQWSLEITGSSAFLRLTDDEMRVLMHNAVCDRKRGRQASRLECIPRKNVAPISAPISIDDDQARIIVDSRTYKLIQ